MKGFYQNFKSVLIAPLKRILTQPTLARFLLDWVKRDYPIILFKLKFFYSWTGLVLTQNINEPIFRKFCKLLLKNPW